MNLFTETALRKIVNIKLNKDIEYYMYKFLEINKDFILENTNEFVIDDLWYSQYYWFSIIKFKHNKKNGYDAGMEQIQFQLIEIMQQNGIDINWNIIEEIDQKLSKDY